MLNLMDYVFITGTDGKQLKTHEYSSNVNSAVSIEEKGSLMVI